MPPKGKARIKTDKNIKTEMELDDEYDVEFLEDSDKKNSDCDSDTGVDSENNNDSEDENLETTLSQNTYSVGLVRNSLTELDYNDDEDVDSKINTKKKVVAAKKTTAKKNGSGADGDNEKKTNRRPGRPPKKLPHPPLKKKGIISEPTTPDTAIELMYGFPIILKKVMAHFKSLATEKIQVIFRPEEVIMFGRDHNKHSRTRVRIDGKKLHYYYCKGVYKMIFVRREIELILNKVDKDYRHLIIHASVQHIKKYIVFSFENGMKIDEKHHITLREGKTSDEMDNENDFLDEDSYTLSFTFPGKYFKKTISDIRTISKELGIVQESKDDPLDLVYRSKNQKIQSKHTCKNSKTTINFKSKLDDDETFRVDIMVDYIKPISQAQVADSVDIFVDENKQFMTRSTFEDGTIEIKTLTEIIDKRKQTRDIK